ncbi:SAM-dependent methyltransferase [Streptomyces lydicus]|uniref:SAM-dependent methyltransferase n=1 Tax=Streptomyces lydicus TaxID=47763 RepID=UPI0036EB5620
MGDVDAVTHWQHTYGSHPDMYGQEPSASTRHAAAVFRTAGAQKVLELGAGHGRDALFFAREGFAVTATDFSPTGLEQLRQAAHDQGVGERVTTVVRDVREPRTLWCWSRLRPLDDDVDADLGHGLDHRSRPPPREMPRVAATPWPGRRPAA